MFSGLTNQVSSWMGAVKGENDEEVPQPSGGDQPQEQQTYGEEGGGVDQAQAAFENVPVGEGGEEDGAKATSPTKAAGMFSNVKHQVSGWLPSMPAMPAMPSMPAMPAMPAMPSMPSIPTIPGLKKNASDADGAVDALVNENAEAAGAAAGGSGGGDDDEDRSSATEGADSRPASGPGTPSDEKAGQVGIVTTKVTQGAKNFGSFLYSAVNKAGAKIKETVKDNNILGEFSKEQEAFIKGQQGGVESGVVPWSGHQNEEKVKEEILGLSSDRRNFVRAPPAGVDFEFNYDLSYPTAVAIMAEDSALEKMRFDLVPKIITEENFWRNYFYRVSLICQASDLGTLGAQESDENEVNKTKQNATLTPFNSDDNKAEVAVTATSNPSKSCDKIKQIIESEFVSDTFRTTDKDLEEVKAGMKILGIDSLAKQQQTNIDEEQWERDLDAELQEYEVVNKGNSAAVSSSSSSSSKNKRIGGADNNDDTTHSEDWEKDVDDLLGDEDDLK